MTCITCHMVLCVGPIKVITCFYLKLILLHIGIVPDEDLRVEMLLLINSIGAVVFSVRTSLLLFRLSYLVVLHLSLIWVFGMCTPVWYFWSLRGHTHNFHNTGRGWRIMPSACERRSLLTGVSHGEPSMREIRSENHTRPGQNRATSNRRTPSQRILSRTPGSRVIGGKAYRRSLGQVCTIASSPSGAGWVKENQRRQCNVWRVANKSTWAWPKTLHICFTTSGSAQHPHTSWKCGVRVQGRREEPDIGTLRPQSKPQELPVMGKDGDGKYASFRSIMTNQSSDLVWDTTCSKRASWTSVACLSGSVDSDLK